MRTIALSMTALLACLLLAGCQAQPTIPPPTPGFEFHFASLNGLRLSVQAPAGTYVAGGTVPLHIIAANTTNHDINITAPDGALVYVALVRKTRLGPETVK